MLAYADLMLRSCVTLRTVIFTAVEEEDVWASFKMLLVIMGIDYSLIILNFWTLYQFAQVNMLKVTHFRLKVKIKLSFRSTYIFREGVVRHWNFRKDIFT